MKQSEHYGLSVPTEECISDEAIEGHRRQTLTMKP